MSLDALSDFVSSLDNLPSEVHHILQEIGHKEGRHWDFRNRAMSRDQSIQKHSRPVSQGGQGLLALNLKEESAIAKTRTDFDKAEQSAREKLALSERGAMLLDRHLTRLASQLEQLTPNVPPPPNLPSFAPIAHPPASNHYSQVQAYNTPTAAPQFHNGYAANSYGMGAPAGAAGMGTPGYGYGTPGSNDKRKIAPPTPPIQVPLLPAQMHPASPHHGQHPNAPYPYPAGTPLAASANRQPRPSRLSNVFPQAPLPHQNVGHLQQQQQQHLQQQQQRLQVQQQQQAQQQALQQQQAAQAQAQHVAQIAAHSGTGSHGGAHTQKRKRVDEEEEVGEGEDGGDGEDLTPYCLCQRASFGEMIGCDSQSCKIEWFHLSCVGLKNTPEGSWFCEECTARMKAGGAGRKRQK